MSSQPNILFIVSDQMTAALTGVYGHPVVQTPHLQRLADCKLANEEAALPHDGDSLHKILQNSAEDRFVFAQAHEAVGVPCIMARQGTPTDHSTEP